MDQATGMLILQAALKWGPVIALEIAKLFQKPTHTLEDWIAIFEQVKTYDQMDAESKARVAVPTP